MPKHRLELLVLTTVFVVAPATAGHRNPPAVANHHKGRCPYERAREEAAAAAAAAQWRPAQASKEPTTITLTERVPADSSLWSMGHGSSFLNP